MFKCIFGEVFVKILFFFRKIKVRKKELCYVCDVWHVKDANPKRNGIVSSCQVFSENNFSVNLFLFRKRVKKKDLIFTIQETKDILLNLKKKCQKNRQNPYEQSLMFLPGKENEFQQKKGG